MLTQKGKHMTADEALQILEQILPPGTLTPLKVVVFQQSWNFKEYAEIAKESGYDPGYVREAGAELWRSLSQVLQQPVKKKNFRTLLQQQFSGHSILNAAVTESMWEGGTNSTDAPELPGVPLPLQSRFYIEHPVVESNAYAELIKPGSLLRIQAPPKMGKSSFLLRILGRAANSGYRVVTLNLKQADEEVLCSLDRFLYWLCTSLSYQLDIEPHLEQYWNREAGSKLSCTLYLTKYLLNQICTQLVIALNEFDQVLNHPALAREVIFMLQSWNEDAKQMKQLQKLHLIIIHSIDISTTIQWSDRYSGSFGLPVSLPELNSSQVYLLAQRYGLHRINSHLVQSITGLVEGHPYLIQLAFFHLWHRNTTLAGLLQSAASSGGIYAYHLQSYLTKLTENPMLTATFMHIMHHSDHSGLDPLQTAQLESLGLIKREDGQMRVWCKLYQQYFTAQLSSFLFF